MAASMELLSLPDVMIESIFSYLAYDEIAKMRLVSRAVNDICCRMLNRGFLMIERKHALALKSVKTQLPRRESERRYHPLARHCDILTSIETRISMLNMTYMKFIDHGLCCFIPGKVIDEIRRVLSIVETSKQPPRAHEVLQELRDISSMAIEHFDDKISPTFRKQMQEGVVHPSPRASMVAPLPQEMLCRIERRSVLNSKLSLYLASRYKIFYKRMHEYKHLARRQCETIKELNKKQRDQESAIAELKKRIEECDIKYNEITHTNQAAGGKVIAATSVTDGATTSAQPLRHFGSQIKLDLSVLPIGTSKRSQTKVLPNIKPRKPMINLPSLSEEDGEPPAKVAKVQDQPSTSGIRTIKRTPMVTASPRSKCQATIAKIKGISQQLQQMSKGLEGNLNLKRLSNIAENIVETKKVKVDKEL